MTQVPGVFLGSGVSLGSGTALQEDVAPTVAVLAGMPVPRHAKGDAVASVLATATSSPGAPPGVASAPSGSPSLQRRSCEDPPASLSQAWADDAHGDAITASMDDADRYGLPTTARRGLARSAGAGGAARLRCDRLASWRALVAACWGARVLRAPTTSCTSSSTATGGRSRRSTEDAVSAFFNGRMVEAASRVLASAVAALSTRSA